jgi:hypothetical protein
MIAVRCVADKEWRADVRKIAEMVMPEEEGVTPECEVVESVADETLAGKGCADKAVSPGDEYAPAGDHASAETTASEAAATECIPPPPNPPPCIPPPKPPPWNAMAGVVVTIAAPIAVEAMQPRSLVFMSVGASRISCGSSRWETMPGCQAAGRSSGDVSVGSPTFIWHSLID